jgi:hypothetical protein
MKEQKHIPLATAFRQMFGEDTGRVDESRLATFKAILANHSEIEIKEALRLRNKDKGEDYAPFVRLICFTTDENGKTVRAPGSMTPETAAVRHSQLRTLWTASQSGFNLAGQTWYNAAIAAAQAWRKEQKAVNVKAKRAAQLGILQDEAAKGKPFEKLTDAEKLKIMATAQSKLVEAEAKAAQSKADGNAREACKKAGGLFLSLHGSNAEKGAALVNLLGKDARAIVNAAMTYIMATTTQKPLANVQPVAAVEAAPVQAEQQAA